MLETVFYSLLSISIGFNMLTLCSSTWCMIFGPGLAIRGPEGSMSRAVEGMYVERKWALRFYGCGLFFLVFGGIVLAWLKFGSKADNEKDDNTAAAISGLLFLFCAFVVVYVRFVVRPKFKFPEHSARAPDAWQIQGLDTETGTYVGQNEQAGAGAQPRRSVESARETAAKALTEVNWLKEQVSCTNLGKQILHNLSDGRGWDPARFDGSRKELRLAACHFPPSCRLITHLLQ